MGYTIVSSNTPSSVALNKDQAIIIFIEMLLIKCQILIPNLNMPKTKWGGAEEPIINHFFTIDRRKF